MMTAIVNCPRRLAFDPILRFVSARFSFRFRFVFF